VCPEPEPSSAEHAVTDRELADGRADCLDLSGKLAAEDPLRRLTAGQGVDALEEAIDVIRSLWNVRDPGPASFDGRFYQLIEAARGPAPVHDVGLWVGAFKPRMLNLVGRKADGWWPTLVAIQRDGLIAGNAAIDAAALEAGRQPTEIRRLLNVRGAFSASGRGDINGPPSQWVDELAQLSLEVGVSTFILATDDPHAIETFAAEVAPAVREVVEAERSRRSGDGTSGRGTETHPTVPIVVSAVGMQSGQVASEYDRLGVTPTPDNGTRLAAAVAWDESTRPHRPPAGPDVTYSDRGRLVGQQLVNVHDLLRTELAELRGMLAQVRDGALNATDARSELNEMASVRTTGQPGPCAPNTAGASLSTTESRMTPSFRTSLAQSQRWPPSSSGSRTSTSSSTTPSSWSMRPSFARSTTQRTAMGSRPPSTS